MGIFGLGKIFRKKDKEIAKKLMNKLKEQKIQLANGTEMTIKFRPNLSKDKSKITVMFDKRIEDVDFNLEIFAAGAIMKDGIGYQSPEGQDIFHVNFKATKKF